MVGRSIRVPLTAVHLPTGETSAKPLLPLLIGTRPRQWADFRFTLDGSYSLDAPYGWLTLESLR